MKKTFINLLLLSFLGLTINAQHKTVKAGDAMRTEFTGTYLGTFQPEEGDKLLMPELTTIISKVNKSQNQEELAAYKDSLMKLKRAAGLLPKQTSNKTTASIDPVRTFGFNALGNQGTPSDNTIAVGNDGKMIAAVNSSLRVYSTSGNNIGPLRAFPSFWSPVTSKTDLCDPLVHYDPDFDRFIVFTQICDRVTQGNQILVAFSATNDPGGAYNYYSFNSNLREVLGSTYPFDVWFDYPKMAVSKSDLFITGNMFRNTSSTNSQFVESAVFQIDKAACFAGSAQSAVTAVVFTSIPGNPFTIVPAGHGRNTNYGDQMHMCATRNFTSTNIVRMYTVNGNVKSNPTLSTANVTVPTYSQPADAVQPGTNVDLNTGDMRGMSAMYVDGTVHFVYHSSGPGSYVAINYNRFTRSGNSWTGQHKLISIPNVDLAFPSVASMGWTDYEQSALIVFNYSSLSSFPGIRAIFVDHNLNVSNYEELNSGADYVSFGATNGNTRWGDYSGIAREHNAGVPTVWGFGMYGNSSNTWSNYISKIEIGAWPIGTNDIEKETDDKVNIFPNPVVDTWSIKLNLNEGGSFAAVVYDMQGKKVKDILKRNVSKGESIFKFNKNGLANGSYFVKISLNDKEISNEKIIVSK